jgi:type IV fimbrial biogenesis protein FimT
VRNRGFTLIELLIALALFAFLIMLAGPMYADFMGNSQIRNAAENSLTGVRFAQTVAVKGNTLARFVLDPAAGGGWTVNIFNDETSAFDPPAQSYQWADGASRTIVTATPAAATEVTFNGLGRVVPNLDATASLTQIDVTNTNANPRKLRVVISATGSNAGTKLCDPDPRVIANDPNDARACP